MNAHIPLVEPHGAANTQKPQSHEAGAPQLAKRAGLALIRWRDGLPAWACVLAGLALALITWAARSAVFGDSPKMPYATFYPMVSLAALCGPPLLGATATLTAAALVLVTVAPLQGGDDVAALVLFVLNSALTVGLAEFLTRLWSDRMTQTARAHALEQLKSSIVDSSDDAIITKTLDGRISSWNPAATRILGYSAQEMIGQPVTRLFPPQDIGQESAILAHLRAGGRARHFQTRRIAKDGRAIDVALTISPLRDDQGRVIGASKILRDITRQKASEDALRASEARLRFALEGARAAAWQWDVPTMTSSWEPHFFALHGVDLTREPSFAAWLESVVEEDRAGAEQAARAALTPGAPDFHCEYRVRAKAGGPRWLEIFGRVERDADGAPLRMSGISRDITERRAALEAAEAAVHDLARANESLKKFSYIAAHDLQEPLRKIQQFFGIRSRAKEPLLQVLFDYRSAAALTVAVFSPHLLTRQGCIAVRAPIHRRHLAIGQAVIKQLRKIPLAPVVVFGVGRNQFAAPVDHHAHALHLLAHAVDVRISPLFWMDAALDRRVLGR
jgi:PAS domain S-box-containing protein